MINSSQVSVINGVSLLTRKGEYKTRYSLEERLQLLDCTEDELKLYMDIFARRLAPYSKARDQPRDWRTPKGVLTSNDVARHLLRSSIPDIPTIWIATRAWETTKWLGVDVDFRGDKSEFRTRCQQVRQTLRGMGIQDDSVLSSPTPSGGRHYRVFFKQHIRTSEIGELFKPFGIRHQPGKFELFPSEDQAMRLPFGHIPGLEHDAAEWKNFVRAIANGTFRTVDADAVRERCRQKELSLQRALAEIPVTKPTLKTATEQSLTRAPRPPITHERLLRVDEVVTPAATNNPKLHEYRLIVKSSQSDEAEVSRLLEMGIMEPGTRVAASKKVAWHLVFARSMSRGAALSKLLTWVMETGRTTSKDVAADIRDGTDRVEREVTHFVDWLLERRKRDRRRCDPTEDGHDRPRFHSEELQHIAAKIACVEACARIDVFEFALRVLQFAKRYGESQRGPDGWAVMISSTLMRGWPGCSGQTYVHRRTAIEDAGLLRMTREKKQTNDKTGRPRTYMMTCPVIARERLNLSFAAALKRTFQWTNWTDEGTQSVVINDKYRRITSSPSGETDEVGKRSNCPLKLVNGSNGVTINNDCGQSVKSTSLQTPRNESDCQLSSSHVRTSTTALATANTAPVSDRQCDHIDLEVARMQFLQSLFTRPELTSMDTVYGDDASVAAMEPGLFHVLGNRYAEFLQSRGGLPSKLITTFQYTGLSKHSKQLLTAFLASSKSRWLVSLLHRLEEIRLDDGKWLFPMEIARLKETPSGSEIANRPLTTA